MVDDGAVVAACVEGLTCLRVPCVSWCSQAKQQQVVGGGTVTIEKLSPANPSHTKFLGMFQANKSRSISLREFTQHVKACIAEWSPKELEKLLGVQWHPVGTDSEPNGDHSAADSDG